MSWWKGDMAGADSYHVSDAELFDAEKNAYGVRLRNEYETQVLVYPSHLAGHTIEFGETLSR